MDKILFGFSAPDIEQQEKRLVISEDFECWNLKKMEFLEFVQEFKSIVPPYNHNVTDQNYLYGLMARNRDKHPILPTIYNRCSWGLLLPMPSEDRLYPSYQEALFILNLYSPKFLHPLFVATSGGLHDLTYDLPRFWHDISHTQSQSELFQNPSFPSFYNKMMPLGRFFYSSSDDLDSWSSEHLQIGMACHLFSELKHYETKTPTTFHREYFDICVILETLLMRKSDRLGGVHVPHRSEALVKHKFPDVLQCFKDIYKERNNFAHGETFKELKRYSMNNVYTSSTTDYSNKHFDLSEKATNYLRHVLVVFLYLHQQKRQAGLGSRVNLTLIVEARGNLYHRKGSKRKKQKPDRVLKARLKSVSEEILSLMP